MGYSSFIENGYKPDKFDKLELLLAVAGKNNPVYILSLDSNAKSEKLYKEFQSDKQKRIIQVNGTIDIIVKGEEEAKKEASEIYKKTQQPVGIVKYEGQNTGELYLDIRGAIDAAKDNNTHYFVYNHKIDSEQAKLTAQLKARKEKA